MSQPTNPTAPDCGANSDPCLDECCEPIDSPSCDGEPGPDPHPGSDYSEAPVRFSNGEVYLVTEDLAFKDFGVPWGHTRSYSNRVTQPDVGANGNSWFVKEWPYLSPSDNTALPATICLVWVIQESLWFDRLPNNGYKARFFIRPKLQHDPTLHVFTLFDSEGRLTTFFDFSTTHSAARRGKFKSFTDARGRVIEADYEGGDVIRSFVQHSGGLSAGYHYEYHPSDTPGAVGRLKEVTYRVNGADSRRVSYSYHTGHLAHGLAGDLETVSLEEFRDGAWENISHTYYRYYTANDGVGGVIHGLKFVLSPLGYQKLVEQGVSPDTATDEQIRPLAKHEFRYNPDRSVMEETVNSGQSTFGFNIVQSTHADGFNSWKWKNTESLPDGSQRLVFTNFAGQVMLKVFTQMKGGASTGRHWYEYRKYGVDGRLLMEAASSAVESYSETAPGLVTLKADRGLLRETAYYSNETNGAPNRLWYQGVRKGSAGTLIKQKEWQYSSITIGGNTLYRPSKQTVYRSESGGGSQPIETGFSYLHQHFQVTRKTTTLPPVPAAQNGTNASDSIVEEFDQFGRVTSRTDPRGIVTSYEYATMDTQPTREIQDPSGLNLITDYSLDAQGRIVQTLGPVHTIDLNGSAIAIRRARWIVFRDDAWQRYEADGFEEVQSTDITLINPVRVTKMDEAGRVLESIQAVSPHTNRGPLPTDVFGQSTYVRWTVNIYSGHANVSSRRVYFDIPESGPGIRHRAGVQNANYDETHFQYDIMRRVVREESPGGTITRFVYSPRNWVLSKWIGTNDVGGDDRNPGGVNLPPGHPNNMVKVEEYRYDGGNAGGDGNFTRLTQYVSASGTPPVADTRVTSYAYDFRNRRTSQNGEIDLFERYTYDNLDRVVKTERHDTTGSGTLVGKSETLYDNRGRVYRTLRYGIDPATGTGDIALADNIWYDASGNVIKQQPAGVRAFLRIAYDGVNRPVATYLTVNPGADPGEPAGNVESDTVVEQSETTYDAAGNPTVQLQHFRFHNATGTGKLNGPDALPADRPARILYSVHFPDALGRMVATANYGSRKWSSAYPPSTIPNRSDTVLISEVLYNSRGEAEATRDSGDRVRSTVFDDAGRRKEDIQNSIPHSAGPDRNKTTRFTYTPDGALATLTAVSALNGNPDEQVTTWVYGTTLADSAIASSLLVRRKVNPDSATDRVEFSYNRLGQITEMIDQRNVIHRYDYDKLGRLTHDRVTALPASVDGTIRRISYGYEVRGLTATIGSYSVATVGQGILRNEVRNTYNDFEQLKLQEQDHGNGVSADVSYAYEDGQQNNIRLKHLVYPNGRIVESLCGPDDGIDDLMSRVRAIRDQGATTAHAEYQYLGASTFVSVAYPEPTLELTYVKQGTESPSDGGDQYTGLDRFGRIIDQRWLNHTTAIPVERLFYGYDRSSNRMWRENGVAPPGHDELYSYDGLSQIQSLRRGTLNDQRNDLTGPTNWQEYFGYDPTGNWEHYRTQDGQNPPFDQDRTHNRVNALTKLDNSSALLAYDGAGNMTRTPKPGTWTDAYDLTWDAWNRLTGVAQSGPVAAYTYDGLSRRTTTLSSATPLRHHYYSDKWQVLEERTGTATTTERQFLWGQQRLDDLILRDRAKGGGTERQFSLADPLNVVSIAGANGTIEERFAYSAFGMPTTMSASFAPFISESGWETLFGGYRWETNVLTFLVRNRYLFSHLGRWASRDRVAQPEGSNLYWYAQNAVTALIDPEGLSSEPPPSLQCRSCVIEEECVFLSYAPPVLDDTDLKAYRPKIKWPPELPPAPKGKPGACFYFCTIVSVSGACPSDAPKVGTERIVEIPVPFSPALLGAGAAGLSPCGKGWKTRSNGQ